MSALLTDHERALLEDFNEADPPLMALAKLLRAYESLVQQVANLTKATQFNESNCRMIRELQEALGTERAAREAAEHDLEGCNISLEQLRSEAASLRVRVAELEQALLDRTSEAMHEVDVAAALRARVAAYEQAIDAAVVELEKTHYQMAPGSRAEVGIDRALSTLRAARSKP